MRKDFYRFSQLIILIILAGSFILSNFYLPKESYWYSFFLHVTAELVVFFFATFFIEKAIESHRKDEEEKRWMHAKRYAFSDMKNLIKSLAITIFISLHIDFMTEKDSEKNTANIQEKLALLLATESLTDMVKTNILAHAKKISEDLNRDKRDLEATLLLYKDIVPPQLLQPLWSLRSQLDRLIYTLIEEEDFATIPTKTEQQKEEKEKLYALMIQSTTHAVQQYVVKLQELLEKMSSTI